MTENLNSDTRNSAWACLDLASTAPVSTMISDAEGRGEWPVKIEAERLVAAGLPSSLSAVIATYSDSSRRIVGEVGGRYHPTTPEQWRDLVTAAGHAGGRPTGGFALDHGRKLVASFEIGRRSGLSTNLLLADSFDGTIALSCGYTTIRVICLNTLTAALARGRGEFATIRHTASMTEKVAALTEAIASIGAEGETMAEKYTNATRITMSNALAAKALDILAPLAKEGSSNAAERKATAARDTLLAAARLPINAVPGTRNLASLWNGATYLLDRHLDGSARTHGDSEIIDSLLFGARAKRLAEIQSTIEMVMADGSVQRMLVSEAAEIVDPAQIGRAIVREAMN